MTDTVRDSIYEAIASIRLIDPHTHINPHAPASNTLADLLGYHYYTELAHSAGMPKDQIEEDGISHRELVRRLVANLSPIENTAQYRWLIEICRKFFGFTGERLDESNWEEVYDASEAQMKLAEWPQMVLDQSNVEAVFLTNDFDDELEGFDSDTYIPCLRTDDLVFHLSKPQTQKRLAACTGIELNGSLTNLRESLRQRFEHFVGRGARACAISLPPDFSPTRVSDGRATTALNDVLLNGVMADQAHQVALSRSVFWTLAELCDEYGLPFDLMIGVNRGVYPEGVFQGLDLYDSRVSLIQYRELFNAFPQVKFPVSVLASVTNQELVSYAWIFPNVITNGHWWYSNTPSFIAKDAAARLEAVPQTKQIAYYSDAYKLEFVWPKFDMYRRILSGILTDHFVKGNGWSEERAIELGRQVLRSNVDEIFPKPSKAIKTESPSTESINSEPVALGENSEVISIISDDELDPLPNHEEIQSASADDVQLFDDSVEQLHPNADALASDIDPEPLDVGDVMGADTGSSTNPEIRMLRGEDSFAVDEESLLLRPDPSTGELKFPPTDGDDEATPSDE
jgi:glucuronate isomerase